MERHEYFMQHALEAAYKGVSIGQAPFGCCIIRDDTIVACEHNVVWQTTDITAHAEIHAIRVACKKLNSISLAGCSLYSTCEPCPMCFSAIHWAGITTIYYGTTIADAAECGFNELQISNAQLRDLGKLQTNITSHVLYQENKNLFKTWYSIWKNRTY